MPLNFDGVLAQFTDLAKETHHASPHDANQPFMSEAYLYTLFEREDARTTLNRFHRIAQSLGLSRSIFDFMLDEESQVQG